MTTEEQSLADDKMRAEIAKLIAETRQVDDKMRAEIAKLLAETRQVTVMTFVAPFAAATAFVAAVITLTKLFL